MKKIILYIIVALVAFLLGVRYANDVLAIKGWFRVEVAEDSPEAPYTIHVTHEMSQDGKLKTLIVGIYNGEEVKRELRKDLHTRRMTDELLDKAKGGLNFLREKGVIDKMTKGATEVQKLFREKLKDSNR